MSPSSGSPTAPLPAHYAKRLTITEQLRQIRDLPEGEQAEIVNRAEQESREFRGFRANAPQTQAVEDYFLAKYNEWIAFKHHKRVEDFSDEELEEAAFPSEDIDRLCENLRFFLITYYEHAKPRSRLTGDKVGYAQLAKVREALLFWVKYKRFHKQLPPILGGQLWQYMTEVMQAMVRKHPDEAARRQKKPYLGLAELRELIDYDMIHCRSIEYSEQHQAAWCIARLTACRPGSICRSGNLSRNPSLTWGDLDFEVDGEPGKIKLTIHFWTLAIKQPSDPERLQHHENVDPVDMELPSPSIGNLIFSAAHRLLVIAIRRGLLQDITSIDELLNYKRRHIRIKPEFHGDPLFYRGHYKGTGLDTSAPLRADALSAYLKARCHSIGYTTPTIGMNAIRRRAATDLTARIGADATRRIMGHAPGSSILERYYLYIGPFVNQTGVLLEEDISETGFEDHYRRQWAPLATGKLDDAAIRRTRGATLRAMVERLASEDENPPDDIDTVEGNRLYRARLRLYAHRALLEHESAQAKVNLTQAEFEGRQRELLASKFADAVASRAMELQAEGADLSDNIERAGVFVPEEEDVEEEEPQPDLEVGAASAGPVVITMEEEDEGRATGQENGPSYAQHVQAFMETIMNNTLNQELTWAEGDTTCPDCQEDDTVDQEAKEREWTSAQKLEAHRNGNFHTGMNKFRRAAEQRMSARADGLYACPYCSESDPKTFATRVALEEHIMKSTRETAGDEHDEAKIADGWYDPGFLPKVLASTRQKRQDDGIRAIKQMGFNVVRHPPSPKRPAAGEPGVTRAGGYDAHEDYNDAIGLYRGRVDPCAEERKRDLQELANMGLIVFGRDRPDWAARRKQDIDEMVARGWATRGAGTSPRRSFTYGGDEEGGEEKQQEGDDV